MRVESILSLMQIDIFSDPVCPWCFIGKRRLERFLADHPIPDLAIRWRVFQLNPGMPDEGMDRDEYMATKFGDPEAAQEIYARVREAGEAEGIDFNFDAIGRTPSTVDAHRLINMAPTPEMQDEVVENLFGAYFLEGADIGDRETLVEIGAVSGLDPDSVRETYDSGDGFDVVENEMSLASSVGIQGVPCFIIDGKYAVVGAQEPDAFVQVFERIAEMETTANDTDADLANADPKDRD